MDIMKIACLFLLTALLSACSDSGAPMPDAAAIEANNRAVGLMGRFEYEQAQELFSEIVARWPEWNEARVNLAIATLNRQQDGDEARALAIVQAVLEDAPDNLRARYVAGLVQLYLGEPAEALKKFRTVAEADPEDAHAAYYLAQCSAQSGDYEAALPLFLRAMELNPYLRSAYYGAFQSLQRLGRQQDAAELAADYQRLENNPRSQLAEFKYTRMGPKAAAQAVDQLEETPPPPLQGGLFVEAGALPIDDADAMKWAGPKAGRAPSLTTVDLQNDGWPDLLLTGVAAPAAGDASAPAINLVLQGRPGGGYTVQKDHPLAAVNGVNAALWGDFDNDGRVDVYLCRRGLNQLWRQATDGSWEDVTDSTRTAGADSDTIDGAFFDADHDGDLDLFLVNADGPNELLNNNLDGTFRPLAEEQGLAGSGGASLSVVLADLDNDRDVDIVVLNREPPHEVYINDRLWSYRPAEGFGAFTASPALAALAADIDADGQIELYTATPDGGLLRWIADAGGMVQSESLGTSDVLQGAERVQLAASDVNGDGAPDLIVSSARGWAVLSLQGRETRLLHEALAPQGQALAASLPLVGASTSGPGMLALPAAAAGPAWWAPGPGRHSFVTLSLSGRQDGAQSMRSNASGIGARIAVRSGSRWSLLHSYRNHSGPGQSLQPLAVGLGGAGRADFIAIDWSDGVFQSEVDVTAGELHRIAETQRQLSSCPVLFAWNGEAHVFVSDFLGVGGIGYSIGPGEYNTPRPWENLLLPEGLLQPKNHHYEIKIGEPMEENAYLDRVRLAAYDLPPGWRMVMDERMGISNPHPTGEPRFYRREVLPKSAESNRDGDVLAALLDADGEAAPVGALDTRFIGRLESEHILILEFPESLDSLKGRPMLVIDGWVEYPYSQTNFAAWQAGAAYQAPTLEALADGEWKTVTAQFGYPAGMPRRMSMPLAGLPAGARQLRLRTNMQIYWDRIAVAYAEELPGHSKTLLPLAAARLTKPGFARRSTFAQHRPYYDYAELSPFLDTRYMEGFYTRFGPVEELVSAHDDAVAIIGPGEEVHLEFTAAARPPDGWRRYFVLETNGWAKDMDLFTRDGETVGPLPSSGMPETFRDALHSRYNTRYRSGN